jgi:hypothetical protein
MPIGPLFSPTRSEIVNSLSRLLRPARGASAAARRRATRPSLEALEDRSVPSGTSVIASNFNGTAIAPGASIWFNAVAKVSGVGSSAPVTLRVVDSEIDFTANGTAYRVSVPDSAITFSPAAKAATTTFDTASNTWQTVVPTNPGGNVFLDGVALPLPSGLPGDVNPVSWRGTFQADAAGLSVNWQWAAAVYSHFSTDNNALDVKPVDSNQLSAYKNSDHAGTPEAFTISGILPGGARGGGGSNWTGSYSGTASVKPDVVTPPPPMAPSTLSGSVLDQNGTAVAGASVLLTGTDANGNSVSLTAMTDANGNYTFQGLAPGTSYTLTLIQAPPGYSAAGATAGTVNGSADGAAASSTQIVQIGLSGDDGVNYNFTLYNATAT